MNDRLFMDVWINWVAVGIFIGQTDGVVYDSSSQLTEVNSVRFCIGENERIRSTSYETIIGHSFSDRYCRHRAIDLKV